MSEPDSRPELRSERLHLRPFQASDALRLEELINDREIAANTRTIEYPYPPGAGIKWIEAHPQLWAEGKGAIFAICHSGFQQLAQTNQQTQTCGDLMGAIGLEIDQQNHNAELGFWIGQDFRNLGYTTEAARTIIEFGFQRLSLKKIYASHLARNPASGRVMLKAGMHQEGYFRQHFRKWGVFEDLVYYGILAQDLEMEV